MSLQTRLADLIAAIGADVKLMILKKNNADIPLNSSDDSFVEFEIQDDNTSTTNWPNRLAFSFKPFGGAAKLVSWFNEYGELRVTPAKFNTTGFRIFARNTAADTPHSGNVFEIQDNRNDRNNVFGIDEAGNVVTNGTVVRTVPGGPTLATGYLVLSAGAGVPTGTPANTPIIRLPT